MKLANYRSDILRFSISSLLISIVILSNLIFYNSSQIVVASKEGQTYFTELNASISGVIFDNCQEVPTCSLSFEKIIDSGFENLDLIGFETFKNTELISIIGIRYESFEIDQNSEGLRVSHYLKNCAIKIPFSLV